MSSRNHEECPAFVIQPEELAQAGWIYVGASSDLDKAWDIVRDWHDKAHWPVRWQFCDHELCARIRRECP